MKISQKFYGIEMFKIEMDLCAWPVLYRPSADTSEYWRHDICICRLYLRTL